MDPLVPPPRASPWIVLHVVPALAPARTAHSALPPSPPGPHADRVDVLLLAGLTDPAVRQTSGLLVCLSSPAVVTPQAVALVMNKPWGSRFFSFYSNEEDDDFGSRVYCKIIFIVYLCDISHETCRQLVFIWYISPKYYFLHFTFITNTKSPLANCVYRATLRAEVSVVIVTVLVDQVHVSELVASKSWTLLYNLTFHDGEYEQVSCRICTDGIQPK